MFEPSRSIQKQSGLQDPSQTFDLAKVHFASRDNGETKEQTSIAQESDSTPQLRINELDPSQFLLERFSEHLRMMTLGVVMGAAAGVMMSPLAALLFSSASVPSALAASFSVCVTLGVVAGTAAAGSKNDLHRRIGFQPKAETRRPKGWTIQDEKDSLTIRIASLRKEQSVETATEIRTLSQELLKLEQDPRDFNLRRRCQELNQESTVKELLSVLLDCLSNGKKEFIDFYGQNGIESPIDRVRELSWSPERLAKAIDRDSNPRALARLDERRKQNFDWKTEYLNRSQKSR